MKIRRREEEEAFVVKDEREIIYKKKMLVTNLCKEKPLGKATWFSKEQDIRKERRRNKKK